MKKALRFIPSILWMFFIFFLSSRSTTGIGTGRTERFLILKTFHLIEYALLFLFLFFAFRKKPQSLGLAYLYALSDEFHQWFIPGREGKFVDTLIDLLGIVIGIFILEKFVKISFLKKYL